MKKNKKKKGIIKPGLITGTVVETLLLLAMMFALSRMIDSSGGAGNMTGYIGIAICFFCAFIGGLLSANGKLENALICGAIFAAVKILLTAFTPESDIFALKNILITAALLLGSVCGGLIVVRKRKTRKK